MQTLMVAHDQTIGTSMVPHARPHCRVFVKAAGVCSVKPAARDRLLSAVSIRFLGSGSSEDPIGDFQAVNMELALFSPWLAKKPQVSEPSGSDSPKGFAIELLQARPFHSHELRTSATSSEPFTLSLWICDRSFSKLPIHAWQRDASTRSRQISSYHATLTPSHFPYTLATVHPANLHEVAQIGPTPSKASIVDAQQAKVFGFVDQPSPRAWHIARACSGANA
eukprot:1746525-Pleurochrysis_carterae.AAC.1